MLSRIVAIARWYLSAAATFGALLIVRPPRAAKLALALLGGLVTCTAAVSKWPLPSAQSFEVSRIAPYRDALLPLGQIATR